MNILSAKALNGKDLAANSMAILNHTDGPTAVCVCSNDAMELLFGGARAGGTHTVEGVEVTFVNWVDVGGSSDAHE